MKPKVEFFKAEDFWQCINHMLDCGKGTKDPAGMYISLANVLSTCNALLAERGTVVYGSGIPEANAQHGWVTEGWRDSAGEDTHTALLIAIEPIAKDTAEGLLREMLETHGTCITKEWTDRARKLLHEKAILDIPLDDR